MWRESDQKNDGIFVGLTINDVSVIVSDKTKPTARYLAAKVCVNCRFGLIYFMTFSYISYSAVILSVI